MCLNRKSYRREDDGAGTLWSAAWRDSWLVVTRTWRLSSLIAVLVKLHPLRRGCWRAAAWEKAFLAAGGLLTQITGQQRRYCARRRGCTALLLNRGDLLPSIAAQLLSVAFSMEVQDFLVLPGKSKDSGLNSIPQQQHPRRAVVVNQSRFWWWTFSPHYYSDY